MRCAPRPPARGSLLLHNQLARWAAHLRLDLLNGIEGTVDLLRQRLLGQVVRLAQPSQQPAKRFVPVHGGYPIMPASVSVRKSGALFSALSTFLSTILSALSSNNRTVPVLTCHQTTDATQAQAKEASHCGISTDVRGDTTRR